MICIPSRRPAGAKIIVMGPGAVGEGGLVAAIGVHQVDFVGAITVAVHENDLLAIRRPAGVNIIRWVFGQAGLVPAIAFIR
jgi:hypothetical protein